MILFLLFLPLIIIPTVLFNAYIVSLGLEPFDRVVISLLVLPIWGLCVGFVVGWISTKKGWR